MAKKRVLTEYQLERLKEHKYSSTGNTCLDPFMQIFWRWLVEQIPTTWAPNSITLTGLICNIVTTILLMVYCSKGYGYAPSWVYILCAVGLFLYQSLDAIDGKQARRTSSSTPLGELFDHGCDAMSMVLIVVGCSISTQLGTNPVLFAFVSLIATSLFYLAQWRTYVTNQMHFGYFDVTEGQLIVILLYLYNAIFGEAIWAETILGLQIKTIFWLGGMGFCLLFVFNFVNAVFFSAETKEKIQQQASTENSKGNLIPHHLRPFSFLFLLWSFVIVTILCSREALVQKHPVLFVIFYGTVSTKMSCLILVSSMTKLEASLVDSIFIFPLLLLAWQILALGPEYLCLIAAVVLVIVNLLYYVVNVCCDICDSLGIHCFKITPVMQVSDS